MNIEQRLKRLGLWTLEERHNRADLLKVFKMNKGLSLTPFSRFFTISNVSSTHGHTAEIVKSDSHLDIRRFFFSQRVTDRWNGLPQSIISSNSINSFKNGLSAKRKVAMGYRTSRTNQSTWPSGHTRSVHSSPEQVRPHLVSYLVSYWNQKLSKISYNLDSERYMVKACA